jgi:transposase
MEKELLKYILPEVLTTNFTIVKLEESFDTEKKRKALNIYLDEENNMPPGYNINDYESKGFTPYTTIQDFPIREKLVYLNIRRRRWREKENKNHIIQNDYSNLTDGSRITKELTDFLKDRGRYPG